MKKSISGKIDELNRQIQVAQGKIKELEAERDLLESNDRYAIAEHLHSSRCHWNHTDGCGWYYETWEGTTPAGNSTRRQWLEKADTVIEEAEKQNMKPSDLLDIMELV